MVEHNNNEDEIKAIENEIEEEYQKKAIGAQIRARVKWVEQGEKNTKYFLNLEKSRQTKKSIIKIYDKDGNILDDQTQILNRQKEFYENLYSSTKPSKTDIEEFIEDIKLDSKLSDEESNKCEGLLTEEECYSAINKMKSNKSPGLDGLTVEFYRTFWKSVNSLLINALNEGYKKRYLIQLVYCSYINFQCITIGSVYRVILMLKPKYLNT